ncbi:hypothetical protein FOZ61_001255 [Perkinsus olseni]|uniref:Uncharacterized protein n=1 Tax=Perkinsus olseni TaxID=32597 RepID=A0A7J6MFN8_PEROL|nr:hypothetical protein FOZ61_001255 [Perkinsus olseni]
MRSWGGADGYSPLCLLVCYPGDSLAACMVEWVALLPKTPGLASSSLFSISPFATFHSAVITDDLHIVFQFQQEEGSGVLTNLLTILRELRIRPVAMPDETGRIYGALISPTGQALTNVAIENFWNRTGQQFDVAQIISYLDRHYGFEGVNIVQVDRYATVQLLKAIDEIVQGSKLKVVRRAVSDAVRFKLGLSEEDLRPAEDHDDVAWRASPLLWLILSSNFTVTNADEASFLQRAEDRARELLVKCVDILWGGVYTRQELWQKVRIPVISLVQSNFMPAAERQNTLRKVSGGVAGASPGIVMTDLGLPKFIFGVGLSRGRRLLDRTIANSNGMLSFRAALRCDGSRMQMNGESIEDEVGAEPRCPNCRRSYDNIAGLYPLELQVRSFINTMLIENHMLCPLSPDESQVPAQGLFEVSAETVHLLLMHYSGLNDWATLIRRERAIPGGVRDGEVIRDYGQDLIQPLQLLPLPDDFYIDLDLLNDGNIDAGAVNDGLHAPDVVEPANAVEDRDVALGDNAGNELRDQVADEVGDAAADGVAEPAVDGVADGAVADGVADGVAEAVADEVNDEMAEAAADGVADGVAEAVADGVADGVAEAVADEVNDEMADAASLHRRRQASSNNYFLDCRLWSATWFEKLSRRFRRMVVSISFNTHVEGQKMAYRYWKLVAFKLKYHWVVITDTKNLVRPTQFSLAINNSAHFHFLFSCKGTLCYRYLVCFEKVLHNRVDCPPDRFWCLTAPSPKVAYQRILIT